MTPSIGRSDTGASRSILSPVFLGPATLLQSSAPLNWGGILVEKYVCRPGERGAGNVLDAPVLAMLCSPAWRGEHVAADGTFASHSKTVGALTVVPNGPLPAARSLRQCDLLYCAFDRSLVSDVRNEIPTRALNEDRPANHRVPWLSDVDPAAETALQLGSGDRSVAVAR